MKCLVLLAGTFLCCAATHSVAQGTGTSAETVATEHLKGVFLECTRLASTTVLPASEVQRCSVVSEALQRRAFGGDFDRMLAWWRSQRVSPAQRSTELAVEEMPQD